jgi:hypothetical protein
LFWSITCWPCCAVVSTLPPGFFTWTNGVAQKRIPPSASVA